MIPHYKVIKDNKEIGIFIDYMEAYEYAYKLKGEILKTYVY